MTYDTFTTIRNREVQLIFHALRGYKSSVIFDYISRNYFIGRSSVEKILGMRLDHITIDSEKASEAYKQVVVRRDYESVYVISKPAPHVS